MSVVTSLYNVECNPELVYDMSWWLAHPITTVLAFAWWNTGWPRCQVKQHQLNDCKQYSFFSYFLKECFTFYCLPLLYIHLHSIILLTIFPSYPPLLSATSVPLHGNLMDTSLLHGQHPVDEYNNNNNSW